MIILYFILTLSKQMLGKQMNYPEIGLVGSSMHLTSKRGSMCITFGKFLDSKNHIPQICLVQIMVHVFEICLGYLLSWKKWCH